MKKGFTLIELLVVVLIIGILAAIALPQYNVAVQKARFTSMIPILDSIAKAEELYYYANGEYTSDWNELDISFPLTDCLGGHYKCDSNNNAYTLDFAPINTSRDPWPDQLYIYGMLPSSKGPQAQLVYYLPHQTPEIANNSSTLNVQGKRACRIPPQITNNDAQVPIIRLCKTLGGTLLTGAAPTGGIYLLP